MTCLIPEYAIGIRAWRTIPQDAFGLPRCCKDAIHGMKIGTWYWTGGKKVTQWERIIP